MSGSADLLGISVPSVEKSGNGGGAEEDCNFEGVSGCDGVPAFG